MKLDDNSTYILYLLVVLGAFGYFYHESELTKRAEFNKAAETIKKLEASKTTRIELDGKYYEVKALPEPSAP